MTGLNKIIERISQDSVAKCDSIIFDANNEAAKIKNAAIVESDSEKQKVVEAAKVQAKTITEMAESSAQLATRKKLLATRVEIINDSINTAYEKMKAMPNNDYFAALYSLVKKYAQDSEGTMLLSQKDLGRKPKDFDKKINEGLLKNAKITVSDKPANIGDGFILVYGDVEINCTFDALIEDSRDDLKDKIYNIVFA